MKLPVHTENFLKAIDLIPKKSLEEYTIEEWRLGYAATVATFGALFTSVHKTEDFKVKPSESNRPDIPVRYYQSFENNDRLWIYVHGGGWCRGSVDIYDTHMRELANGLGLNILSVDYRLAPENPFPAAHKDVLDVFKWVKESFADENGIKQVYLGGDSAGGNITCGVVCRLIEDGYPLPDCYIGIYPPVDFSMRQDSYKRFETGYLLTTESVKHYVDQYIVHEENKYSILASTLLYQNLKKFPKTLIITAEADPLADEQVEFVHSLKENKVDVLQIIVPGVIHPFMMLSRVFPEVKDCIEWLKENL
ncbi:MAG: alpha/beta hydrolase [Proteobacteria bacterium]|nr:alpha/beta hydrolase [Pseudomonadota bacterium]